MTLADFRCRASGSDDIVPLLSLGRTPLANSLLTGERLANDDEPRFPLDLVLCPASALVQITETVPPEILFRDYVYFSSFSDTVLANARDITTRLIRDRKLGPESLVVEVASNDGYLLKNYVAAGVPVLGIEPATNIAAVAEKNGIRTRNEFFGADFARTLRGEGTRADVIHANNVLAHVADLPGVVEGFRTLLKDSGVAVIEVPYVKDMVDRCEFDTIYHEHLCYFSLTALDRLFRRHGLFVEHVERIPIHGGTIRVFAAPNVAGRSPSKAVTDLLAEEASWGVDKPEAYRGFAQQVGRVRTELRDLLGKLKKDGKRVAAYGAAAKGSTLLNYCEVGTEFVDFVVDRSTYKQGLFMPGVHLPIKAPETLSRERPDYLLLLAWNFADEIMAQQADFRAAGGKFIVPVPAPRVI